MANKKISELPAAAGMNLTDLLAKVNDPSGSPETQKATISQLVTLLLSQIQMVDFATIFGSPFSAGGNWTNPSASRWYFVMISAFADNEGITPSANTLRVEINASAVQELTFLNGFDFNYGAFLCFLVPPSANFSVPTDGTNFGGTNTGSQVIQIG